LIYYTELTPIKYGEDTTLVREDENEDGALEEYTVRGCIACDCNEPGHFPDCKFMEMKERTNKILGGE
jgi:hypothetical protein